jgi:hypothetical protein
MDNVIGSTSTYVDPASKCIDGIAVPFSHHVLFSPDLDQKERDQLTHVSAPFSLHSVPFLHKSTDYERDALIVTTTPPSNIDVNTWKPTSPPEIYGPNSSIYEKMNKRDVNVVRNESDGELYLDLGSKNKFKVIAPLSSHILDDNGVWHQYDEYFDGKNNVSHLHVLNGIK